VLSEPPLLAPARPEPLAPDAPAAAPPVAPEPCEPPPDVPHASSATLTMLASALPQSTVLVFMTPTSSHEFVRAPTRRSWAILPIVFLRRRQLVGSLQALVRQSA
jgi:hypothetical protein